MSHGGQNYLFVLPKRLRHKLQGIAILCAAEARQVELYQYVNVIDLRRWNIV